MSSYHNARHYAALIQKNPSQLQIIYGKDLTAENFRQALKDISHSKDRISNIFKVQDKNLILLSLKVDSYNAYYMFRCELETKLADKFIYRATFPQDIEFNTKTQDDAWKDLRGLAGDANEEHYKQLSLFQLSDLVKR